MLCCQQHIKKILVIHGFYFINISRIWNLSFLKVMFFFFSFSIFIEISTIFNGICIKMTAYPCLVSGQLIYSAAVPGLRASCLAQCTSLAVRAPAAKGRIAEGHRTGKICSLIFKGVAALCRLTFRQRKQRKEAHYKLIFW
jgi:hypothetical protein